MNILENFKAKSKLKAIAAQQKKYQVQFYNFWKQPNEEMYWYLFLRSRGLLNNKTIAFISCLGDRRIIDMIQTDIKIFFTGENLRRYPDYADYCLIRKDIDLAIGFDVFEDSRYIRFPLWMMDYTFAPTAGKEEIIRKCAQMRFPDIGSKRKFCCMVASNGADGLRDEILDSVSQIKQVDSAGRYRHNDDSLQSEFEDNKLLYLHQYNFNICPENTSAYGYTTEKLFQSITAGCIPVYWGAEFADKVVINEDAVIRWDRNDNGKEAMKKINELWSNELLLSEFLSQPRLKPTAEEYILDTFATIESKLRTIINSK